jgi:hypothetical protein
MAARRSRKPAQPVHGPIRASLEGWLPSEAIRGADAVRVEVARRLADELDAPGTAAYTIPRIAGALALMLDAIETVEAPRAAAAEVKRLLQEVAR